MRLLLATLVVLSLAGCSSERTPEPKPAAANVDTQPAIPIATETREEIDWLLQRGENLYQRKEYAASAEAYGTAIERDPQNAVAWRGRARARLHLAGHSGYVHFQSSERGFAIQHPHRPDAKQLFEAARDDLKRSLELDAANVDAWKLQGWCLTELGDRSGALSAFDKAVGLAPDDADAFHKRAVGHVCWKRWPEALHDLDRAIELDPDQIKSLVARAGIQQMLGDRAAARVSYDEIIRRDPEEVQAWVNRADIELWEHNYEKAVSDCTRAIEIDPSRVYAWSSRGAAWSELGETSKALADFDKAIELDPHDATLYAKRAVVFVRAGLLDQAVDDADRAVSLAPDHPKIRHDRAWVLRSAGREPEARAAQSKAVWLRDLGPLDEAAAMRPADARVYERRGAHFAADGQWDRAAADFTRALELDPTLTEARLGRAKVRLRQGDYRKSIEDCNRALEHSDRKDIYSIRGDAWLELKDYDRTIADYQRATRFDPGVARAYRLRASARRAAGDTDAADADLRQAQLLDPSHEKK